MAKTTNMKIRTGYVLALSLLIGCAVSRKVEYGGIYANVPAFKERIGLACWDQREQVVNGSRHPDFVGYTRSGVGIAYPMGTADGRPFADNMTSSIAESLTKQGSTITGVITSFNEQESQILSQLKKTNSHRLILIDCKDFYTDGYGATSLMYNLQINIYGEQGDLLKQKTFSGKKALGGSAAWGPGNYKEYMPEAFKKLIEEIFNDSEITAALQN